MTQYEYEYLTKEQKIDAIVMRKKINEADLYDFELQIAELNLAVVKDQVVIDEFTARINDKISQNIMLDELMSQISSE